MAIIFLVAIVIPYTVDALRIGMYPHLEKPWASMSEYARRVQSPSSKRVQLDMVLEMPGGQMASKVAKRLGKSLEKKESTLLNALASRTTLLIMDPRSCSMTPKHLPRQGRVCPAGNHLRRLILAGPVR